MFLTTGVDNTGSADCILAVQKLLDACAGVGASALNWQIIRYAYLLLYKVGAIIELGGDGLEETRIRTRNRDKRLCLTEKTVIVPECCLRMDMRFSLLFSY